VRYLDYLSAYSAVKAVVADLIAEDEGASLPKIEKGPLNDGDSGAQR
jgi:hypothetical protein